MDAVAKDIGARAKGWLYTVLGHNVRATWSLTRQEILFWQHGGNEDMCKVPWWLLGEEHKTELVAKYLASAAERNHPVIISQLLCSPVAGLALVHGDRPVGHHAAQAGSIDAMRVLLRAGADVRATDGISQSMLHVAASFSRLDVLSILIKAGADSRARDNKDHTPLHIVGSCRSADRADTLEIVFRLIESGAPTTCRNAEGRQPLEEALYCSNVVVALGIVEGKHHSKHCTFQEHGPTLLHKAIMLGCVGAVKEIVTEGVDTNTEDESGLTPLMTAVTEGHRDIVEVLLQHHAYPIIPRDGGQSALHLAIDSSRLDIISTLVRGGARPNNVNGDGFSAINYAIRQGRGNGNVKIVQALLSAGVSVEEGKDKHLTSLHLAAEAGQTECVRLLLNSGAVPGHCWNDDGVSPLFLAAGQGHAAVVKLLLPTLTSGQIDMRHTKLGDTALTLAIHEQHREVVRALLQYGATVDFRVKAAVASLRTTIPRGLTEVERAMIAQRGASAIINCLFEAIVSNREDYEDLFHTVLRSGVRLSIPSVEAQQLLQIAAEYDRPHAVEILLGDYGVNPDDTYLSGVSCLYLAAKYGFGNIVLLFLRFKADCKIVDMHGNSALMEGASRGHDAVVHSLLEAGAKPWTANHDGNTALHLAVKRDHSSTVEILVREGNADAHAFNRSGESPLSFAAALGYTKSVISLLEDETLSVCRLESLVVAIYFAAKRGQVDCLKAIIRHGVSIDRKTQTGWNSLQRAVRQSDIKTARILLQHGASVTQVYPHGNSIMHYTTDSVLVSCLIGHGAPVNCRNVHNITPLHKAAHKGKGETVELLLGNIGGPLRYEVNSKNNNGMTALHYAVKGGHVRVVDALIDGGASPSVADRNGQTSIHMAVELDSVLLLNVLMRYDCHTPNIEDSRGLSPVHLAIQNGHLESLEALLASPTGRELLDYQSECNGRTPLHVAAGVRCFGAVNALLQAGASVEKVDVLLQTPLHIAAASGDGKLVTLLLDCGALLGAKDNLGQTPLLVAVGYQHVSIVHIMLTEGASSEVTHVNGQTAMHIAVEGGGRFCLEIVQALIAHGAPVTHRDKDGYTPLHVAVMMGQTDVVLTILQSRHGDCGISVADNITGDTPLHDAAGLEHPSSRECIVTMLLVHGAPVDARNREGTSPLLRACACEYLNVAQTLLNNGASPGTGGEKGFTPLHHACKKGQTEVAWLLLDNGAVPGHCWNVLGVSPLHHAAKEGHLEVVKLLLPRLVVEQINLTTKKGRTPLMDAVSKGYCDIVDALLQAGADPNEGGFNQFPPLSIAADSESNTNSMLVVQSLLKKGANPGTFCREGYLPLHRACAASGDMQIVKALLNAGTPVTSPCPGEHFHLPLHFAALHGHAQAVWALASVEGCQLDEKDARYRRTPLTTAIFEGHTETVRALLELGAPLESDITDKTGAMIGSHVHLALLVGHTDICQLLLQAMAFEAQADDAQP